MARRSARISNRISSTPQPIKRVSLSHDASTVAPRTLPTKLGSLQENDEMPGSFPESPTEAQPMKRQKTILETPTKAGKIMPSMEEMHPQATHQSTMKADTEARWLGFSALPTTGETTTKIAITQTITTPSRASTTTNALHSPRFEFTFQRQQSLELSPAAKSLMQEKRAEALRIKEQMKSTNTTESVADALARKIVTPKSQRTRFSEAHSAQFQKMDSIAGHASAYRKDPNRVKDLASPSKPVTSSPVIKSPTKSLLPAIYSTPSKTAAQSGGLKRKADVQLTRLSSEEAKTQDDGATSARKRVKVALPSQTITSPAKVSFATPTKSQLARSNSAKTTPGSKIPAPTSTLNPTPTAARGDIAKPAASQSAPLLKRSPLKAPGTVPDLASKQSNTPGLFDRSPIRPAAKKEEPQTTPAQHAEKNSFSTSTPLQARHPLSSASLMGRFEKLRSTPVKSILRTPQRLYSDDPSKVAAGTHLATPPHNKARRVPATAPVRKQVDFSASTKLREDIKEASLSPFTFAVPKAAEVTPIEPSTITYPSLDDHKPAEPLSAQKRRQSSGPQDFTFRVGNEIVFAPVTTPTKINTPRATSAYTIRHVSAEPELPRVPATLNTTKLRKINFENAVSVAQTTMSPTVTLGSKKRKFDFENEMAENDAVVDKENMPVDDLDEQRPTKRVKQTTASPRSVAPTKTKPVEVKKRTTLGVKPKSALGRPVEKPVKRTGTTISMARLAALAQPKKR